MLNLYAIISQHQRAVFQKGGSVTPTVFRQELIKAVKEEVGMSDFNASPYLMLSEQNDAAAALINRAVSLYAQWISDGKPLLA